ncbi:MAG: threonine ammonia-lyase [Nitrospirota bacterium]|nr:threonine ammonia-lyase [Nitrospirota bacterium]MDH5769470.1 threonine ammonia-lyase [Nitrospirota bacterium]
MIGIKDIYDAVENISRFIHKTPLIYSNSFSKLTGAEVYLKAENLQKTGSFKVRGAFNRMVNISDTKVIAASMGNHAQAVAFAASKLEIRSKIVMPVTVAIVKEEATKSYGAEVVLYGENFNDALDYAILQKDYRFIHAFDDDHVIAGQGTIGVEIMEDLQDIDVILVPVGGGGLIAGISIMVKALSPQTKIIGVQTVSAQSAYVSYKEKKRAHILPSTTIADGIAVGKVGEKTFEIMNKYVDDILLVGEDSVAMSILLFLERKKLVVEGAGAVPLAALIENREKFKGKRIVLVVSGGNIDFTLIDRIIHKGLVTSGRIGVFEVTVDDMPGSLHEITGVIAYRRGNILNVVHDRLAGDLSIGKTKVIFTVETRGKKHLDEILSNLTAKGFGVRKTVE